MAISNENRDALLKALEDILDTRDKRYMFLRMEFPNLIPYIQLEGSAQNTSFNIYIEFEKQGMIGSLIATLNSKFDLNLLLNL